MKANHHFGSWYDGRHVVQPLIAERLKLEVERKRAATLIQLLNAYAHRECRAN